MLSMTTVRVASKAADCYVGLKSMIENKNSFGRSEGWRVFFALSSGMFKLVLGTYLLI